MTIDSCDSLFKACFLLWLVYHKQESCRGKKKKYRSKKSLISSPDCWPVPTYFLQSPNEILCSVDFLCNASSLLKPCSAKCKCSQHCYGGENLCGIYKAIIITDSASQSFYELPMNIWWASRNAATLQFTRVSNKDTVTSPATTEALLENAFPKWHILCFN